MSWGAALLTLLIFIWSPRGALLRERVPGYGEYARHIHPRALHGPGTTPFVIGLYSTYLFSITHTYISSISVATQTSNMHVYLIVVLILVVQEGPRVDTARPHPIPTALERTQVHSRAENHAAGGPVPIPSGSS